MGGIGGSPKEGTRGSIGVCLFVCFLVPPSRIQFQIIDLRFLGCMGGRSRGQKGERLGFGKHDGGGCSTIF